MIDLAQDVTSAIKELRRRSFPSQQSLAEKLRTSVRTVAHWEAGRKPSFKSLVQLASVADELRHFDLAAVLREASALDLGSDQNNFMIEVHSVEELDACLTLLEVLRNPNLKSYADAALKILSPAALYLPTKLREIIRSLEGMRQGISKAPDINASMVNLMKETISQLSAAERDIINRHYLNDEPIYQIAKTTKLTVGEVRMILEQTKREFIRIQETLTPRTPDSSE